MRRALLLPLLLGACAPAAGPAQRAPSGIASTNPCTDAILAEVADPAQIAALSAYSADPASSSMDTGLARRFASTTGTAEELIALRPALVVGGSFTPPATRAALVRSGIAMVEFPIASTVAESQAQIRALARLAGHPERGEALVARIEAALAAAAPPAGTAPLRALVWQSGGIVPGADTLVSDILSRTGFASHSVALGLGQADYLPLERVLATPPQIILAATQGTGEDERALAHPVLAALPSTRWARFDPSLLWCGGPTIARAAARLGQIRKGAS